MVTLIAPSPQSRTRSGGIAVGKLDDALSEHLFANRVHFTVECGQIPS